ncbi:DUF4374 domain-containing protein [Sphingobacterium sp. JB170]|uniref:DUF4374 domain-containing protein n=1 Tax=Sphingobacterium sp. JB170 TaxID=1434842 RepID=UPI00097F59CF|nr:DUF4374 domain-containing protein [Sphingobacterium sp. JB170]SJN47772.1 hypothetical protein FM107_16175 [Sphingobacterium sp. JB170]
MYTLKLKQFFKSSLYAALAVSLASCSNDDDTSPTPIEGDNIYTLGLGVTTTEGTTNYVLHTNDIMSGKLSLINNGILQDGYRDYLNIGSYFFSIGGLGLTDINTYYLDASNQVALKTGLNLNARPVDAQDLDGSGKTALAVTLPSSPADGTDMSFLTIDVASNAITRTEKIKVDKATFPIGDEWMLHSGIAVRGNQAFQTLIPFDDVDWVTSKTDKAYVAIYSYPEFELEKIIEDDRTGPAGAFNTRSGIFATESGDIYTISHSGFGYTQRTKEPAVLKIASGSDEFDKDYYFNTEEADNGGRIIHAIYIGNNKLFASITTGAQATQWADDNLKFAIVDLAEQSITTVKDTPTFSGEGGRSFAAFHRDGKAYAAAKVNGIINIYEIDLAQATARKGAEVEASFVGGLGQIK